MWVLCIKAVKLLKFPFQLSPLSILSPRRNLLAEHEMGYMSQSHKHYVLNYLDYYTDPRLHPHDIKKLSIMHTQSTEERYERFILMMLITNEIEITFSSYDDITISRPLLAFIFDSKKSRHLIQFVEQIESSLEMCYLQNRSERLLVHFLVHSNKLNFCARTGGGENLQHQ